MITPMAFTGQENAVKPTIVSLENLQTRLPCAEQSSPERDFGARIPKGEEFKSPIEVNVFELEHNPTNFSKLKKWRVTIFASLFTILVSATATSYNLGIPSMMRDLNCTRYQATIGLSVYALAFGVVPLFTSAASEEFGRQPLYIVSTAGFLLMHLMVGLSTNVQTVIVARALQGSFGSTGATLVAGTIADVWDVQERGLPMSIFAAFAFGANGLGATVAGWVEMNPKLEWRWIQWISLIISGVYFVFVPMMLPETRHVVALKKFTLRTGKSLGNERGSLFATTTTTTTGGVRNKTFREMLWISCTRPLVLLFTEPIVLSVSVWIGFAWGVYYYMISSIPGVFRTVHHFNEGEIGTVYVAMTIGALLGFISNFFQERLYKKYVSVRGVEARLYCACAAGILLPLAMLLYAWSSTPGVHWVGLVIAVTLFVWAAFVMYLAIFTYLADCYGTIASSALAGQSLLRNVVGGVFPLFTETLFVNGGGGSSAKLGYRWTGTLFAGLALVMVPIPFVLFFWGPRLRGRSVRCSKGHGVVENSVMV